MFSFIAHYVLLAFTSAVKLIPKNNFLYCYTIRGKDGLPYLTRVLFPRRNGRRWLLHYWHRPDADKDLHNHPWADARGRVLLGGYVEDRLEEPRTWFDLIDTSVPRTAISTRIYRRGDQTELLADTFHQVAYIQPRTWTLLNVGERVQRWSFRLGDGTLVDWEVYMRERGLLNEGDGAS